MTVYKNDMITTQQSENNFVFDIIANEAAEPRGEAGRGGRIIVPRVWQKKSQLLRKGRFFHHIWV